MNYGDLSSNVENSRTSLRRIARHEEPEFSNASILNSMEKFMRTVNEMEDTILVPSRLLDLAVGDASDTVCLKSKRAATIKDTMANTDLFRLYNIVNKVKVELLWSQESQEDPQDEAGRIEDEYQRKNSQQQQQQDGNPGRFTVGHVRRPSTTSMQSVHSAASIISSSSSSDSDSDTGIENDSGLESEETSDLLLPANQAAENFRRHLRGLHRSINWMTEAAEYLTLRYQADVGGQV